ncbi:MAG: hypothetical protein DWQ34_13170 [Planctomycetota bacterium]|nr:MAG: hypothetical protein DWQ34_13170 [Planctomycetota bacterium]REK28043.1 MAG: hypothetical protein DWQ41_06420 [Planctomycetota bacterium]REK37570.1 MAG: hypothetical protein DWQ45_06105 [Planctomycetota bacterium]
MDAIVSRQTLDRLKRGVPPVHAIDELSVGMRSLRKKLDVLLAPDASPRWFYVTSEYGEGKSHFHCYAKHYALERGYAVASLDVNGDDGALNHPQRHFALILDSIRSSLKKFEHCQGFAEIVRTFMEQEDPESVVSLLSGAYSEDPYTAAGTDPNRLWGYLWHMQQDDQPFVRSRYFSELLRYLSGQDLINKSWYGRFAVAYRLQLVQRILRDTGHQGLLLFVDEIDNVVRQIGTRGHPACFRTLAWYCSAPVYPAVRVIFASTPEVIEMLDSWGRSNYGREIRSQKTVRPEEVRTFNQWSREAEEQAGQGWHSCPKLTAAQRVELFHRIAGIHSQAWGCERRLKQSFVERLAKQPEYATPRRWVRTVVRILDLLEQNGLPE